MGPIGIENIRDGTSNTGLFSERLIGLNGTTDGSSRNSSRFQASRLYRTPSECPFTPGRQRAEIWRSSRAVTDMPGTTAAVKRTANGIYWAADYIWYLVVNGYTHNGPPNSVECPIPAIISLPGPPWVGPTRLGTAEQ